MAAPLTVKTGKVRFEMNGAFIVGMIMAIPQTQGPQKMTTLTPCPCGGETKVMSHTDNGERVYWVACKRCYHLQYVDYPNREKAIKDWNKTIKKGN